MLGTNPRATKRARKDRPRIRQKPGLTAKGEARKFVQHNYVDHANETHEVIGENDDSIFEKYFDCKEDDKSNDSALDSEKAGPNNDVADDAEEGDSQLLGSKGSSAEESAEKSTKSSTNLADITSGADIEKVFCGKKLRTAPFPLKLHILFYFIRTNNLEHVASWLEHGRAFRIDDTSVFEKKVMSQFFSMSKITSFHRQLNLYGFRRLTQGRDEGAYYHEYFLRGKPYLTANITRTKVKGTKIRAASSPDDEPDFYSMVYVNAQDECHDHHNCPSSKGAVTRPNDGDTKMISLCKDDSKDERSSSSICPSMRMKDKRDLLNNNNAVMRRKGGVYKDKDLSLHKNPHSEKKTVTTVMEGKSAASSRTELEARSFDPLPFSEPATGLPKDDNNAYFATVGVTSYPTQHSSIRRKGGMYSDTTGARTINSHNIDNIDYQFSQDLKHPQMFAPNNCESQHQLNLASAMNAQYTQTPYRSQFLTQPQQVQTQQYFVPHQQQPEQLQQLHLQQQQYYNTYFAPIPQVSVPTLQANPDQTIISNQHVYPTPSPCNIQQQCTQQLSQPLSPDEDPQLQHYQSQTLHQPIDFVTHRRASTIATSSIAETCETAPPISQSDHILDALTEDICSKNIDIDDYRKDLLEKFTNWDYDSLGECDMNFDEDTIKRK